MNTVEALKIIRNEIENDEELKKKVKEYNELCAKLYITSLAISIAKAIIKSNKENPS